MNPNTTWNTITTRLREAREARQARARLFRDLRGYTTKGELEDLLSAAERSDSPDAELTRTILRIKLQRLHDAEQLSVFSPYSHIAA